MDTPDPVSVDVSMAAAGPRVAKGLAMGTVALGSVAIVLGVFGGGTRVAGIDMPGAAGVVSGILLLPVGLLGLWWTARRRPGDRALWSEGDVLFLHAHAGPVLTIRAGDLRDVMRIREPGSTTLRWAFGTRMFTVRSAAPVSPGVSEVPVGERFVEPPLEDARDQILAWVRQHGSAGDHSAGDVDGPE